MYNYFNVILINLYIINNDYVIFKLDLIKFFFLNKGDDNKIENKFME